MEVINTEGGEARNFSEVTEVLFDDMKSKVKGCRYLEKKNIQESGKESFKEVFAPLVISNAGARITYSKWIPASVNSEIAKKISNVPSGLSSLIVYIGFKESSAKLGIQGENYWIFSDYDHDKMAANCSLILDGKPQLAFVSFGSSHNPEIKNATAQIITFIEPHAFEKWKNTKYQNRGDDYKELKNNIALTLIDFVEKHIVGFKDLIEFVDVGTPLTVTHYTDQPYGEIYGLAGTQERYTILKNLGVETPIKNFYITGADVSMAGIAGALLGGVLTFAKIAFYDCLSPQLRRFITSYFYKKFRNKFLGQRK
jgi:phytoene dehydrogenase-like protein